MLPGCFFVHKHVRGSFPTQFCPCGQDFESLVLKKPSEQLITNGVIPAAEKRQSFLPQSAASSVNCS